MDYVVRMQTKPALAAIAAALIAFTPFSAFAKTWWTDDGMLKLETVNDRFEYMGHDMRVPIICTISDWPISSPTATLDCDDGEQRKMQLIDDQSLIFDGVLMTQSPEAMD
jgi:hypothetical protein